MLPKTDWLDKAKRLAVGMRIRVHHGSERRPNMVICNDHGKYWAYCQACHEGGVEDKEHVRFGEQPAPTADLSMPSDLVRVLGSVYEIPVARFLASKNMDMKYLPELWYSCTRKRILIDTGYGWMGRDITERSPQKWLTYNRSQILGECVPGQTAVVVEDTFSWYKVKHALQGERYSVLCALGTDIKNKLTLELLRSSVVVWMFDGDSAGYAGAAKGTTRIHCMGLPSVAACAPEGKDPKDMEIQEIQRRFTNLGEYHEYDAGRDVHSTDSVCSSGIISE